MAGRICAQLGNYLNAASVENWLIALSPKPAGQPVVWVSFSQIYRILNSDRYLANKPKKAYPQN